VLYPVADENLEAAVVHPDRNLDPHLPIRRADEVSDFVAHTKPVAGLVKVTSHRLEWSHIRDIGHVITGIT
jgi:hypothetical protein